MSPPLGLFIQPACLQHRYIRHSNSSHIFERPERLRAVLLGVAAAVARLEEADATLSTLASNLSIGSIPSTSTNDDLSSLLSSLSIGSAGASFVPSEHLAIVPPPVAPRVPGQILQHHPALQLAHSPPPDESLHSASLTASSAYLKDLLKWASEAVEKIKETGCEIPSGLGLNQGDLYLGPGSILAIEGAIQTVCQAIDRVCTAVESPKEPATPPIAQSSLGAGPSYFGQKDRSFKKAFCAIRPPGHHCGEDAPSGFCYVNNVVVGALHAYLEHDIDRAIIIDFDLHHGNGTQALVMPLNAATYAEELAIKAGKPDPVIYGKKGKRRRGWKGFYGSVHDIYSYPCEDGDLDLISDASISLAAHGQYIENIHLQPYTSEEDFYERIYPKYLNLLDKAKVYMDETQADPDRTIVLISAGFDACEHEHQAMQRHDRRVPVSFFSRYTKDIVAFADKYTEGKVVSVLEGGYSDRALTSAAMGHVIGLLDRSGAAGWWSENELLNIEKATKKRRTGKIAPFPPELSNQPHLARTHALLAHFEGTPPEAIVPSATSTPQQASRMTLRDRRKPAVSAFGEEDVMVTPPARKAVRGRTTGTTPKSTPGKVKVEKVEYADPVPALPVSASAPIPAISNDSAAADLVESMGKLSQGDLGQAPNSSPMVPLATSISTPSINTSVQEGAPKVFLRFTRPPQSQPASGFPPSQSLYPSLPISSSNGFEHLAYRERGEKEGSVEVSTESETEYASARSELSRTSGQKE